MERAIPALLAVGLAGFLWIALFAGYPEIFLFGLIYILLYVKKRCPFLFRFGIKCSKFELDLSHASWPERIFKASIAVLLPANIALRIVDFVIALNLLLRGGETAGLLFAPIVGRWGIVGLALAFSVLLGITILATWFLYGIALHYRGGKGWGFAIYVILEIIVVGGLLLGTILGVLAIFSAPS